MNEMKKNNVTVILVGMVLGAALSIVLGGRAIFLNPSQMEIRTRGTCYNLEIQRHHLSPQKQGQVDALVFLLDSTPFMQICAEGGRIRNMVMLDCSDSAIAESHVMSVQASDTPCQWRHLYYGKNPSSEQTHNTDVIYEDIDFDGDFDRRIIRDETGQVKQSFISLRGIWYEVNPVDSEKGLAGRRDMSFRFVPYSGWEQTNDGTAQDTDPVTSVRAKPEYRTQFYRWLNDGSDPDEPAEPNNKG